MTTVRDVMSGPVLCVDRDTAVADAALMMRENDTGDVVVLQDGRLAGIVTDRDLAIRVVAESLDPGTAVGEVCSNDPVTITPDEDLVAASELMREHAVRRLPVSEGEDVVGFISLGDLAKHQDTDQALSDISTAAPNW